MWIFKKLYHVEYLKNSRQSQSLPLDKKILQVGLTITFITRTNSQHEPYTWTTYCMDPDCLARCGVVDPFFGWGRWPQVNPQVIDSLIHIHTKHLTALKSEVWTPPPPWTISHFHLHSWSLLLFLILFTLMLIASHVYQWPRQCWWLKWAILISELPSQTSRVTKKTQLRNWFLLHCNLQTVGGRLVKAYRVKREAFNCNKIITNWFITKPCCLTFIWFNLVKYKRLDHFVFFLLQLFIILL